MESLRKVCVWGGGGGIVSPYELRTYDSAGESRGLCPRTLFYTFIVIVCIILPANNIWAQQNSTRLTPEQQKTVQSFLGNNFSFPTNACITHQYKLPIEQAKAAIVKDIDPILVSKYFVFSPHWLSYIGSDRGKQISRQQFKKWTDSIDKLYECFEEFMGGKPYHSDILYVGLCTQDMRGDRVAGHAGDSSFCLNPNHGAFDDKLKEMRQGRPTRTVLHEMGHVFSSPHVPNKAPSQPLWFGGAEPAADFLVSYALEKGGFRMGTYTITTGPRWRFDIINNSVKNFRAGNIDDFAYSRGTAYDIYLFSLPSVVGWDTVKKAIQSYKPDSHTFTLTKRYDPGKNINYMKGYHDVKSVHNSRAHEFFDRIVYFHDEARSLALRDLKVMQSIPMAGRRLTGAQVLRSFPDKGKLLDEYFTVETTPLDNVEQVSAPVATEPPPVQKSEKPLPPPEEEIRFLQAEIKTLQERLDSLPKTRAAEPEMIRLYNQLTPLKNRLSVLTKRE